MGTGQYISTSPAPLLEERQTTKRRVDSRNSKTMSPVVFRSGSNEAKIDARWGGGGEREALDDRLSLLAWERGVHSWARLPQCVLRIRRCTCTLR